MSRRTDLGRPLHMSRGVTLVELVILAAVLSLVGAMAIPRVANLLRRERLDMASRRVMADLRLVRTQAIRDQADRKLVLNIGMHEYAMPQYGGGTTTQTVRLNGEDYQGVRLRSTSYSPVTEVVFGRLGVPQAGGTITLGDGVEDAVLSISGSTGRITRAFQPGG